MHDINRLKFGGVQYIVWQGTEQALVITRFNGSVTIQQKGDVVVIEDENFAEVMKLLRETFKSELQK